MFCRSLLMQSSAYPHTVGAYWILFALVCFSFPCKMSHWDNLPSVYISLAGLWRHFVFYLFVFVVIHYLNQKPPVTSRQCFFLSLWPCSTIVGCVSYCMPVAKVYLEWDDVDRQRESKQFKVRPWEGHCWMSTRWASCASFMVFLANSCHQKEWRMN